MASAFSSVDQSPDPDRLIHYLDAIGCSAMKQYMATAHALRRPTAPILSVGCGVGHDLTALAASGLDCVGVDPSRVMLQTASGRRRSLLAQAAGQRLPFGEGVFAGCLIERVLMHVEDPLAVISEVRRCVRSGGLVTVFEPDWSTLTVNNDSVPISWVSIARAPSIGGMVGELLETCGCRVVDRVEERSTWDFTNFAWVTQIERSLQRAVEAHHVSEREAHDWLDEQRRRAATGNFRAEIAKILWVATTPA